MEEHLLLFHNYFTKSLGVDREWEWEDIGEKTQATTYGWDVLILATVF